MRQKSWMQLSNGAKVKVYQLVIQTVSRWFKIKLMSGAHFEPENCITLTDTYTFFAQAMKRRHLRPLKTMGTFNKCLLDLRESVFDSRFTCAWSPRQNVTPRQLEAQRRICSPLSSYLSFFPCCSSMFCCRCCRCYHNHRLFHLLCPLLFHRCNRCSLRPSCSIHSRLHFPSLHLHLHLCSPCYFPADPLRQKTCPTGPGGSWQTWWTLIHWFLHWPICFEKHLNSNQVVKVRLVWWSLDVLLWLLWAPEAVKFCLKKLDVLVDHIFFVQNTFLSCQKFDKSGKSERKIPDIVRYPQRRQQRVTNTKKKKRWTGSTSPRFCDLGTLLLLKHYQHCQDFVEFGWPTWTIWRFRWIFSRQVAMYALIGGRQSSASSSCQLSS